MALPASVPGLRVSPSVGSIDERVHVGLLFEGGAVERTRVIGSAVLMSPRNVANSRTYWDFGLRVEGPSFRPFVKLLADFFCA